MKVLAAGLQAHLDSGATTLCWCWRLTRRDGARLGFTDHDRDLTFDGTTFEAAVGFTPTDIRDGVGLSVNNLEVESALVSDRLSEDDLAAGLYDDAKVEIFRVNWMAPEQRVLMRLGSIGEVTRDDAIFRAEIRGLAHYLQQPSGRLYQFTCDADLGDARCGVDLAGPALTATATIVELVSPRAFLVSGVIPYADGWFSRGLLTFVSGGNSGRRMEIRSHRLSGGSATLELWEEPALPVLAGDSLSLRAGCDKQHVTCRDKFANVTRFRGFPHMPGNDFVTSYVRRSRA